MYSIYCLVISTIQMFSINIVFIVSSTHSLTWHVSFTLTKALDALIPIYHGLETDITNINKLQEYACIFPYHGVIKWKYFPRYWPFVGVIHRWPVNYPHKSQLRGAFMFFFYLLLNKRLSKQSFGWWFETPSCPLWPHSNDKNCVIYILVFIQIVWYIMACMSNSVVGTSHCLKIHHFNELSPIMVYLMTMTVHVITKHYI